MNNSIRRVGLVFVGMLFVWVFGMVSAQSLNAPTGLILVDAEPFEITVAWTDNSSDETDYFIEVDDGSGWQERGWPYADTISYTFEYLDCDTSYNIRLRAYRNYDGIYSEYSNVLTASTAICPPPPAAPSDLLLVTKSAVSAEISWTDNSADEAYFIIEHQLSDLSWQALASSGVNSSSRTLTGLRCNTNYKLRIMAVGQGGNSDASNELVFTTDGCIPLAAPSNLEMTATSLSSISLGWQDNANNETGYTIERSSDSGLSWTTAASVAANQTSYSDSVACSSNYQYRVRAYSSNATIEAGSAYSNVLEASTLECLAAMAVPSDLALSAITQFTASFSWTDNASDETTYQLERSTDGGTSWSSAGQTDANVTSLTTNSDYTCETNYQFRIRAYREADNSFSGYSNVVSGSTAACAAPIAPSGFHTTAINQTNISFAWTNNEPDQTRVYIERSSNNGSSWSSVNVGLTAKPTSHTWNALSCNTSYQFRIYAYRSYDLSESPYSDVLTVTTAACAPAAPTSLTNPSKTQTSINLSWVDNTTTETSYRLERSSDGGTTFTEIAELPANSTSYSNTGLFCGRNYRYRVRAHRSSDNIYSSYSSTLSVTTSNCPAPPSTPSALSATASGSGIQLNWTDNATTETNYLLERSSDGGTSWTQIASLAANSNSYIDNGISCGQSYSYRVRAYNNVGSYSGYSSVVSATKTCVPMACTIGSEFNTGIVGSYLVGPVALSSDGSRVALSYGLPLVGSNLYDVATQSQIAHFESSVAVDLDGDGSHAVMVSDSDFTGQNPGGGDRIFLWNDGVYTQITDNTLEAPGEPHISDDGTKVVFRAQEVASSTSYLYIWDAVNGLRKLIPNSLNYINNYEPVVFSGDGSTVAFVSHPSLSGMAGLSTAQLYIWDAVKGLRLTSPLISGEGTDFYPYTMSINYDGTRISFSSNNDYIGQNADLTFEIFLWDTGTGLQQISNDSLDGNLALSINASGERLFLMSAANFAGTNADNSIEYFFWDSSAGFSQISNTSNQEWTTFGTSLSADGSVLALLMTNVAIAEGEEPYPHLRLYIGGCSDAPALTRPAAPTALSVAAGMGTSANLSWTDNATDETAYRIQVSANNGLSWTNVATIAANSSSYTDTNVPVMTCGTNILYRVQAYKSPGNIYSASSNQASFATVCEPRTPTNLRVGGAGPKYLLLQWDDNSQVEETYRIDHSLDGISWTNLEYTLSPNTTSYGHSGLYCNSVHYYRVNIWDFQSAQYSAYSNVLQATVPDCTETLPALNLTVDTIHTTTNSIAFSPNLTQSNTAFIEYSSDGGITWSVLPRPQRLTCNTSYDFRIRDYDYGAGKKTPLFYITASTKPCSLPQPSIDFSSASSDRITFYYSSYNAGAYTQIERSDDGGLSWDYLGLGSSGYHYDLTVVCESYYQYRLRLYDDVNNLYSEYSEIESIRSYTCPPATPSNLVAVVNAHSVSLSWEDNADDEIYYQIYRDSTATQLSADSESYTDLWITCGSSRRYRVRAYSSLTNQYSANSNEVTINFAPCESQQTGTSLQVTTSAEGTDGVCGYDHCTLHEAITRANNLNSATITLVDGIYYGGWPRLIGNSTLIGVSPETTILEGEDSDSWVLAVEMGNANLKNLSLRNAQIGLYARNQGFSNTTVSLENVRIEESTYYGIQIQAVQAVNLTLLNSVIQNLDSGALPIFYDTNNGTLSIEGSSIINNQTGGGTVIQFGSWYVTPRTFNLTNSTISNNQSSTATKTGVFRSTGMPVLSTLSNNTIANNAAGLFNIANASSTVTMNGNLLSNCDMTGSAISTITGDYNLVGTNVNCSFSGANNLLNVNPLLLPLADNGGFGLSHAFELTSPALDGLPLASCSLSEDQRGEARPWAAACDIGAIELAYLDAPGALAMTAKSETSISLLWDDTADNETAYLLERSDDGISWDEIAQLAADSSSHNDTGLSCDSVYDYRVRAYKADDELYSAYSNLLTVSTDSCPPPSAATALTVTGTSASSVSLGWTDNASDETAYSVERSLDGVTWTAIQAVAANSTSYPDNTAVCNTAYQYRVRAYRSGDGQYSSYSNVVTGTTSACPPPDAPSGLTVSSVGHTNISLSWTDNASDETQYRIERSADSGATWTEIIQPAANSTSHNDTSAVCNTGYQYRIRAYRSGDNQFSDYSNVVTGTTDICITLNAPTDIQLTGSTETSLSIGWTDESTNESGYEIERSLDGTNWTVLSSLSADSTSHSDSGLTCSTGYQYRVRSKHVGTETYSPYGSSGVLTTASCPPLVASVLSSTGATQNSISLSWTVDNSATSFTLAYYNGSAWVNLGIFPSTSTTYTHTGLICGRISQYQVTTFRTADSASVTSSAFSTSTSTCPPLGTPNAPVVLNTETALVSLQIPAMPATATSMSLERSSDGVSWTSLGTVSSNYLDTAVVCGGSYQYRLVASRSSDGVTSTSATAIALTDACPIPTVLGVYRGGLWVFVDSNNTATPVNSFNFGDASWQALVGDWDGDGVDGIGIYRNGEFALRNLASADSPENRFNFGTAEAGWQAIAGDWNGDGIDSVGLYKDGLFTLSDDNVNIQYRFNFGFQQAGWQVVAGDWDGNGADGIGLYKDGLWMLANDVNNPDASSQSINYGPAQAGWTAIVGDWNGDGMDSIGLYGNGSWRMRVNSVNDATESSLSFGQTGDIPLAIFEN